LFFVWQIRSRIRAEYKVLFHSGVILRQSLTIHPIYTHSSYLSMLFRSEIAPCSRLKVLSVRRNRVLGVPHQKKRDRIFAQVTVQR
jgi:hypothetical protein